ncbi:MAG: heme-binding protein [Akkermansiaceae bacterium]|nr:heme-binding protein [Akkermansiaceae bacterium]
MKAPFLFLLLAGLPAAAIEKPVYKVLEADKERKVELREYADIPVATAPMGGMQNQDGSFMKLFQYISGDNDGKQKIAMTSPVFMQTTAKDRGPAGSGRMSFMIPAEVARAGAPAPDGKDVTLGKIKGGRIAAIRFKGHKSEEKRQAAVQALQAWITEKKWTPAGKPFFAYYNPPWTPGIFRRNEVLIRIK